MDKTKALGRWPNAPLAYLIAEIKFQRPHDFDSTLPALVERFAKDYPLEESTTFEATLEPGQTNPTLERVRDFKNFANSMGVRLTRSSVALHCTDYSGWQHGFEAQWHRVLEAVTEVLRPRVQLRSSLRNIDLLVPEGDESPDEYLVPGLRPWNAGGDGLGELEQGNIAMRFKQDNFATTLVVLSRIKGQVVLPPTVQAMPLVLSPIQQRALEFHSKTGRPFAIVDTDVVHEAAIPFEFVPLVSQFTELHRLASTAFLSATTRDAQQQWQKS